MTGTKPLAILLAATIVAVGVFVAALAHDSATVERRPFAAVTPVVPAPPESAVVDLRPVADDAWWVPLTEKKGAHFRVTSDCAGDAVVAAALDAAEDAWRATLTLLQSGPISLRGGLLEVRLIRARSEYKAADAAKLNKDYYELGWADSARHTAYVVMEGCSVDDAVAARFGPGSLATGVVEHEASHLVASLCLENDGGCPWFHEGIALVVEERLLTARAPTPDAAAHPRFSTYMAACRRLRDGGKLPDVRSILRGALNGRSIDDYAVAWEFFRFLDEPVRRERTAKMLAQAKSLSPDVEFAPALARAVATIWAGPDLDALSQEWRSYVDGFTPQWTELSGGGVDVTGRLWRQVAKTGESCCALRAATVGRSEFTLSGKFEILRRGAEQAQILLGYSPDVGGVVVSFASASHVSVYVWDAKAKSGKTLAYANSVNPVSGALTRFEIRVSNGEARVLLDGREALTSPLAGHDVSGRWGVDAARGSAVVWENVALE